MLSFSFTRSTNLPRILRQCVVFNGLMSIRAESAQPLWPVGYCWVLTLGSLSYFTPGGSTTSASCESIRQMAYSSPKIRRVFAKALFVASALMIDGQGQRSLHNDENSD